MTRDEGSFVAKGLLPYHGLGSGIKRALEKWPQIDFADDREGCLFNATVRRMPVAEVQDAGQVTGQVTVQVASQVTREVSLLLSTIHGEMTRADLQKALDLRGRANFESRYLRPALAAGLIEMTIPGKPNSRLQRYRLSENGRRVKAGAGQREAK